MLSDGFNSGEKEVGGIGKQLQSKNLEIALVIEAGFWDVKLF